MSPIRCTAFRSRLTAVAAIGERYLVVQIHYTNGCPSTYEPPGFSETDDTILHAADARGWKNERVRFGSVYTGFHSLVTHEIESGMTPNGCRTTLVGSILQHETGLDLLPQNLVFEPVSNTIPDDVALTPPLPNTGHTAIPGVSNSDPTSQGRSQAPDYPLPTRPARVERSPVIPTQSIEHEDSSILLTHPHLSSQAREDKAVQAKLNELVCNQPSPRCKPRLLTEGISIAGFVISNYSDRRRTSSAEYTPIDIGV